MFLKLFDLPDLFEAVPVISFAILLPTKSVDFAAFWTTFIHALSEAFVFFYSILLRW